MYFYTYHYSRIMFIVFSLFGLLQDFGDYLEGYYSVQTPEGEQISQLIAGYIDIILKKVWLSVTFRLNFTAEA